MKRLIRVLILALCVGSLFDVSSAQQTKQTGFDVTHYVIDAQLSPDDNRLTATADVTFNMLEDARNVAFELNGSLKLDSITRIAAPQAAAAGRPANRPPAGAQGGTITFVQDQVGVSDLGPSVRIDLGDTVASGTSITLRFKYSGVLNTPSGGPLLNKRLAYVGSDQGYLMYAARWFPFHEYAADRSTAEITLTLPGGLQAVGYSDAPLTATGGKFKFSYQRPALIGNIAYGKYTTRSMRMGEYELVFNTRPGAETLVQTYGETLGKALEFYKKKFGEADFGKKLVVAQIDDESLDFYSAMGMLFVSDRQFVQERGITEERLQREAAFQWWGLTVGLTSFDDAWLSQGLAEYSAYALRESQLEGAKLDALRRELLEKSLTFEQTASLRSVPKALHDQSIAYQYIMYAKGAFAFRLLRDTIGQQKFDQLLRTHLAENRGKRVSIDDFERLTSRIAGEPMRYFFARWVESTGVPEFTADYLIIRTRGGKFIARGTVKQNYTNLKLPVDVQLRSEGDQGLKTVTLDMPDTSADFNIESNGKPLAVVIDPSYKLLRISHDLRVSSIARRGIEQLKEGNYVEAQQQFEEALKLDRSNSWVYYHLGLLFLEQRNYDLAIDNFKSAIGGSLNPPWLEVWANIKMGNAYDAKGDRVRATAAYKRAESSGDNYDNAQEAVKRYQANPYDPREDKTTAVR